MQHESMTLIKLSDIKQNNFDLNQLIETSFNESIPTQIATLENMKSALFFKQQKLKKDLLEITNTEFPLTFLNEIKSIKVEKENIKILEKNNKKIFKIKIMIKILTLKKQMEELNFTPLNDLLESDNPIDWEFLSYFFQMINLEENQLNEFKKKMTEKFESSLNSNIILLKRIYEVMERLNSINLLVNVYLSSLPIFNIKKEEKQFKKIEITDFKGEWFKEFLKTIDLCFDNENFVLFDKSFKEEITNKLFNETVSANLDIYLNEEDPILFLLKFKDSYIQLHNFTKKLKSFEIKIEIRNLFEHHKNIAIRKEIEGLQKLLNILKNKTENKLYFLNGKLCKKGEVFENFLSLIFYYETILKREEIFSYENSDSKFIMEKFFKTLNELLIVPEDFKGLNILSNVYLVLKKYLIDFPINFLEEKILKIFQKELKQTLKTLNELTNKLTINNLNSQMPLILNKIEITKGDCKKFLKGRNGINFMKIILENLQKNILKFISRQIIKEKDFNNLKQFLEPVTLEFMDLEIEDTLSKVLSIICSDKRVLTAVIRVSKLEPQEVKKYLKLREDYQEIKILLEK